jgi:16S rRNA C1402 (ribose-2'-O) methylase RsmI
MPPGCLYLLAAPVGDRLEDLSLTALRLLREIPFLLFESQDGFSRRLAARGWLHPQARPHYLDRPEHVEAAYGRLLAGDSVVLTASSGLPCFVDPGFDLVQRALSAGPTQIQIEPVGISSALDGVLAASGLDLMGFTFCGHFPEKVLASRAVLDSGLPLVFYLAGSTLPQFVNFIEENCPGREQIVLAAQLRKKEGSRIWRITKPFGVVEAQVGLDVVALVGPQAQVYTGPRPITAWTL